MGEISLGGLSSDALEALAKTALVLAADLRRKEPSIALALAGGVVDRSYSTVRYGMVASYSGEAVITMDDGSRWQAVGHGPQGGPDWVSRQGWVEFIPINGHADTPQ